MRRLFMTAPLFVAVALYGCHLFPPHKDAADGRLAQGPRLGEVAPDIVGEDLDGLPLRLSDYRGKVVAVDFWGNW
jgi:hypothetical protein